MSRFQLIEESKQYYKYLEKSNDYIFQSIDQVKNEFDRLDKSIPIKFIKIDFKDTLLNELDFTNCEVIFEKCNFSYKPTLISQGSTYYFNGNLKDKTTENYIGQISFLGDVNKISYLDITTNYEFHFQNFSSSTLILHGCKITKSTFKNLTIDSVHINGIYSGNTLESLEVIDCNFKRVFDIQNLIVKEFISVLGTSFKVFNLIGIESKCKIWINVKELEILKLIRCNIEFFEVWKSTKNTNPIKDLSITNSNFNDFNFLSNRDTKPSGWAKIDVLTIDNSSKISFNSIKICSLVLRNVLDDKVVITNSEVWSIQMYNLRVDKHLELNNVISKVNDGLFLIQNSLLENVVISPSNLHHFGSIHFEKSSLKGLKTHGLTEIPFRAIDPNRQINASDYLSLYRELKGLALEHNDTDLYHKYKALEYNEKLRRKKPDYTDWDWLVLKLNQLSNNHTTDPSKAFWLIKLIALVYMILLSVNLVTNGVDMFKWSSFKYAHFFINPLKFLYQYNYDFWGIMYLFDIVYKIVLSYLLYQFITAFRKFNK